MSKPPRLPGTHLTTVIIHFGSDIPSFQQHFVDSAKAHAALNKLKNRMFESKGKCIKSLELWQNNILRVSCGGVAPEEALAPLRGTPKPKALPTQTLAGLDF